MGTRPAREPTEVEMRDLWSRLVGSPKALVAVGAGLVAVVAIVAAVVLVPGDDEATDPASASPTSAEDPERSPDVEDEEPAEDPEAPLPPDRDAYCPAYAEIRDGGLTTPGDDESDQVDLAELGRTFDQLLVRYTAAERVSPRRLRDDYAQTIGYLEQGRRAVESKDVDLLKALVVNLDSLNDSMAAIERTSARFCR